MMPQVRARTDGQLLARAARGDADAFSEVYARHETIVLGFLARRTRDPHRAADLTAETFAAAILAAGTFRDEGQSALAWLLGIARNLLARSHEREAVERRALARLGVEREPLGEESFERIEALVDATDPANPLLAALDALPPAQREAVRAFVIDEEPYAALAERLGVGEATMRQRVSRGLASLRTSLGGRTS